MTWKSVLCTKLSTISVQIVNNSVDKVVFLCFREYIQKRNDMQKSRPLIVLRLRSLKVFFLVVAVVVSAVCVPAVTVFAVRADLPTVVIDAGHGGIDGGVTGVNTAVKESDLNLVMSKLVGEYFESGGFRVVYTRKNSKGLYRDTDSNKKRADMERRAEIIRDASPVAVISIHMNTYSASSRRGAQVFFDASSEAGKSLADTVQEELNRRFNVSDAGREFAALAADKYILRQTSAPSIIVECGFLSNPVDEANLLRSDYRAEFAYYVFRAVAAFLSGGA